MKPDEIKTIECDTVEAAELEYFFLREQNCWQVIKPLKVVWSWRKFKTVVRFSVKKVEQKYFKDYMGDLNKAITGMLAIQSYRAAYRKLQRDRPVYKSPYKI